MARVGLQAVVLSIFALPLLGETKNSATGVEVPCVVEHNLTLSGDPVARAAVCGCPAGKYSPLLPARTKKCGVGETGFEISFESILAKRVSPINVKIEGDEFDSEDFVQLTCGGLGDTSRHGLYMYPSLSPGAVLELQIKNFTWDRTSTRNGADIGVTDLAYQTSWGKCPGSHVVACTDALHLRSRENAADSAAAGDDFSLPAHVWRNDQTAPVPVYFQMNAFTRFYFVSTLHWHVFEDVNAAAAAGVAIGGGKAPVVQQAEGLVRMIDPIDGDAYTRAEFIKMYGGTNEWDSSVRANEEAAGTSTMVADDSTVVAEALHGPCRPCPPARYAVGSTARGSAGPSAWSGGGRSGSSTESSGRGGGRGSRLGAGSGGGGGGDGSSVGGSSCVACSQGIAMTTVHPGAPSVQDCICAAGYTLRPDVRARWTAAGWTGGRIDSPPLPIEDDDPPCEPCGIGAYKSSPGWLKCDRCANGTSTVVVFARGARACIDVNPEVRANCQRCIVGPVPLI
eukprot:SAG11_NODE_1513_length_4767_cov_2.236718_2_plen_510_part_00